MTRPDDPDDSSPYRYVPSEVAHGAAAHKTAVHGTANRLRGFDQVNLDVTDHRWAWVRTGLLFLLFGYFCIPVFLAANWFAQEIGNAALIRQLPIVGLALMLSPIAIGWLLCARTPPEAGTSGKALLAGIGVILQIWIALGRIWPDVIFVPGPLINFRTAISVITLALMLRYLQDTFEYLKPGESDRWVIAMRTITNWLVVVLLIGIVAIFAARVQIPRQVVIPYLALVGMGAVIVFVLFYASLFRLWVLLRGEGQYGVGDSIQR